MKNQASSFNIFSAVFWKIINIFFDFFLMLKNLFWSDETFNSVKKIIDELLDELPENISSFLEESMRILGIFALLGIISFGFIFYHFSGIFFLSMLAGAFVGMLLFSFLAVVYINMVYRRASLNKD
jgi:hypothetical protein